jgi:predicted N-formylglutamate amidohydrolase
MKSSLIITCEHGGNVVPNEYTYLFKDAETVLQTHRGWDPGALEMATRMAGQLGSPLFSQTVSRLLIEMNRSLDNYQLFSQYTDTLDAHQKEMLKEKFYFPYRRSIEDCVARLADPVIHLSIHSFTPVVNGVNRTVDIGLLFDPSRRTESRFCERLRAELTTALKTYQVMFNEPYLGIDDGFTTYLRTMYPDEHYAGIEIEVNQRFVNTPQWTTIGDALSKAIGKIV